MASVNDYLKKLLYQYDCVVVPELGAFLTHYQPAVFTEHSGLYLPPRKRVAFNEALRLDDGILANYIMLHEPVTREGAQRHIAAFVNELRQQVQLSGRFDLDEIGMFSLNDEGRLQFEPSLRHNFFGEAYGMSAVPAQLLVQSPLTAVVVQSAPQTGIGPVLVRDEEPTLTPLRTSTPYWRLAATVLLVGTVGLVSYFSVINPGQPLQSSLNPANLLRLPNDLFAGTTKNKEVAKPVFTAKKTPVIAAAPVPEVKPVAVAPVTPMVVTPAVAPTPVAKKVEPIVTPLTKPEVAVAPVAVAKAKRTAPQFTVIAGSFSNRWNAMRLKRQLRKAGYKDAYVISPTQKGQLYKVAAAGSPDRSIAVSSVDSISKLAGTEAWIYKN